MDAFVKDLRFAAMQFRKHPAFAFAAIATLALGIGAAATIFGVMNAVVLQPLPFPHPDRLVRIWETNPLSGDFPASDATYLDFARRNRAFAGMAAYSEVRTSAVLTGAGEPARLRSAAVTASFFAVLGVRAAPGRTFLAHEDRPGGDTRVVVLSHRLWVERFGADPSLVGRTLTLDGRHLRVRGVLPARFDFPSAADVWVPLAPDPTRPRSAHELAVIARLGPGVGLALAQADLGRVARALGAEHPRTNAGWGVHMTSLAHFIIGAPLRRAVYVLFGAVGFLLLIACANVANLLIARGSARQAELGIRAALGAGRGRLARQMLTESGLLALLGALAGLGLAQWMVHAVRLLAPPDVPRIDSVDIDGRVLLFTMGVALVVSLAVGVLPALQASRVDLRDMLKDGARTGAPRTQRSVRRMLVVWEVALAMMLLVGSGLVVGSFLRLAAVAPGFDATSVITVPLGLPDDGGASDARAARFRDLLGRVRALPGVRFAGATSTDPLRQWGFVNNVTPEDRAADAPPGGLLQAGWRSVTPGFFRALGIPLLRGRVLDDGDRADGRKVIVVSEGLARRLWPGRDPVGRRLFWGGTTGTPWTVVGEVGDIRDVRLDAPPEPLMYLPWDQVPMPGMTVTVKTAGDPAPAIDLVRQAIRATYPALPIPAIGLLSQNRIAAMAAPRFRMLVLGAFATAALLLAAVGIYGVIAFAVTLRAREIGIRMALGAPAEAVWRMVVREGMALALAGIALGAVGALALTRLLRGLLFQTALADPATYALVTALLVAVTLLAAYLPARRAARVDPVTVLRGE